MLNTSIVLERKLDYPHRNAQHTIAINYQNEIFNRLYLCFCILHNSAINTEHVFVPKFTIK